MKTIDIKQKLEDIDVTLSSINLGEFDFIGEYTAKRVRNPDDLLYKKVGAFYRSNYERGILIYHLIRQFNLTSMLEIGFGRGYATLCAAKAFCDAGIKGNVLTIDPVFNEEFLNALRHIFPKEWFDMIKMCKATSMQALPTIQDQFDLVYIDGDHSYAATQHDWNACKAKFKRFLLFDDYHMPTKHDDAIDCRRVIDDIDENDVGCQEKEFILMDRIIYHDDRGMEGRDYGQVLLTKSQ